MATQYICDCCREVMNRDMYSIAICKDKITNERMKDEKDYSEFVKKIESNTDYYIICESCYQLYLYLLAMRKEEMKTLRENFVKYMQNNMVNDTNEVESDLEVKASQIINDIEKVTQAERLPNIYFVGKAGAGKTFCARFLIEKYNYCHAKFANPVYMIAEKYFRMEGKDRKLLQTIGTDAGRDKINTDLWINRFKEDMEIVKITSKKMKMKTPKFVMDDCRFPNEHKILKSLGFVGIYLNVSDDIRKGRLILRDGTAQEETLHHKSETLIDTFKDELITMDASGDLTHTYECLSNILKNLRWAKNGGA